MRTGKTHLLCEWSCKKNGIKLSPRNITSANGRKVWWECGAGHTWMAAVYARAKQDAGCPFCTNHKAWPGFNDVASQSPELARQWYQPLNGARTPENTLARSHAKVWWRCEIGHIWVYTGPDSSGQRARLSCLRQAEAAESIVCGDSRQNKNADGGRKNLREHRKRLPVLVLIVILGLSLAACGRKVPSEESGHVLTVGPTQIVLAETPLSELCDAGYTVAVANRDENGKYTTVNIATDIKLSADSVYYGFYIMKDGQHQLTVDVVTDKENVLLSDASISAVSVYADNESVSNVKFDGIPLTELTESKFLELVPEGSVDKEIREGTYKDDQINITCRWSADGALEQLSLERPYTARYSV